jgi:orotidine-5'-phosphate decarboxylase
MGWKVNDPRIIVSLDFADPEQALGLVRKIEPGRCRVKIGKELFTRTGPGLVERIISRGFDVFLDLKFHDIPATVANACRVAVEMGVWMINVHASGGVSMMKSACETIANQSHRPLLVAVTVLTSMDETELGQIGVARSVSDQVSHLAGLARDSGLDGVVCSAMEAARLRQEYGGGLLLVTPGIRPHGSGQDDQRRVMTPADALKAGSDYLVIGRPIIQADDPLKALLKIENEIRNVKCEM